MAAEKTKNLGLTVYPDVTGVYQRELRKSYEDNFRLVDAEIPKLEDQLKKYIDDTLGVIENGTY